MGRTRSQTKARNKSDVGCACLSVESSNDKTMFELYTSEYIRVAYLVQAPEIRREDSLFGKNSVSEVEAEPISHSSAQESKHCEIWNKSMREEVDD